MRIVAERLYLLREQAHLSQSKIARMVGTSQTSINRYEKEIASPPLETLLWYADYFDVSLDYIFGRTDNPHGMTESLAAAELRKKLSEGGDWREFVQMCFDPKSPVSARFKEAMLKMMESDK